MEGWKEGGREGGREGEREKEMVKHFILIHRLSVKKNVNPKTTELPLLLEFGGD